MNEVIYIAHHGILGQKWGIRRFQNEDGSLTDLGRKRYLDRDGKLNKKGKKYFSKHGTKPLDIMSPDELQEKINSARLASEYKKLMDSKVSEVSEVTEQKTKTNVLANMLKNTLSNSLNDITKKFADNIFERMDGSHDKKIAENKASEEASKKKMLQDMLDSKKLTVDNELFDENTKVYKDHSSNMYANKMKADLYNERYKATLAELTYADLINNKQKYTDAAFKSTYKQKDK